MKKKVSVLLVVLLLFSGCCMRETSKSNKITVDLPALNLNNQQLYYYTMGNFGSGTETDSCAIFLESSNELVSEITMVVKTKEDIYQLVLGKGEKKPFNHGNLFACDFDCDGIDEIVFFAEKSGNGYSIAQVFKVTEKDIVLIEDLNKRTDIFSKFENQKSLLLFNKEISYENSIDISTEFPDEFFDSKGMYVGDLSVNTLPIDSLEIVDSEPKLIYNCPIKLTNYIGTIECGLVWSQESSGFVIDYLVMRDKLAG